MNQPLGQFNPASITRPDPVLLTYYLWYALLTVLGFPFVFLPLYCKYRTLTYRFDDEGIAMSWGVLFKREIYLTYRRIQDIHVTRNLFHRWLGLAALSIQTAAGSSSAEMTIEGIREPEVLRDYVYQQMRGVREDASMVQQREALPLQRQDASTAGDEALTLLRDIRDQLRALRQSKDQHS